ncbi:MAG: Methyltransferase domain protein [candidate division WS6 bacterium GW2011_GWC1_36_11]|uniref:Methyltransferase domain protein n=2 Tax=Candidatus Dojkabacteria TaxID=74243 RepID=A0A0G0FZX1_9BACT|nr:MAG: Methyltransferase domain protein [candidate division WS6 bacterium GW2011_GWC1_36_11]KKQ04740.1 MAG: Methyltransferase domain protein [candidate division WS6 bacterium GW2011_WS6_36_26]KKQ17659.1 MAG: Methyltransferase domain protein [candidate division WS6 bacterium GW2011_GWF1_36_8]HAM96755.1 hypothetical protein [Patescibacteria group bacterium]
MGKIVLNKIQEKTKENFVKKLASGEYKTKEHKCLCGENKSLKIGNLDRYGLPLNTVMCLNCGLVRSDPYYDAKTLKSFYEIEYRSLYTGSESANESFFEDQIALGKRIIEYLERELDLSLDGKKVFEVGCGAGGILKAFKLENCDVYGCDYGEEYLKRGRKEGIKLVEGDSTNLKQFGKADLIILNHVLEHFLNSEEELSLIGSLLAKDGLLYVSVPGLLSHRKSYGSLKWYLQNAHVYSFYLSSLEYLMNKVGFRKVCGNEKIRSVFVKDNNVQPARTSFVKKILIFIFLKLSYLL